MFIILLLLLAAPASAHFGPDGGLHDHLDTILYLFASASVTISIWKYKVKAWLKK